MGELGCVETVRYPDTAALADAAIRLWQHPERRDALCAQHPRSFGRSSVTRSAHPGGHRSPAGSVQESPPMSEMTFDRSRRVLFVCHEGTLTGAPMNLLHLVGWVASTPRWSPWL
jgi:hypothetical protein